MVPLLHAGNETNTSVEALAGVRTPLRAGTKISFFGDSITMQGGYIEAIRKALGESSATKGLGIQVCQHGLNGGRVPTVLEGTSPWGSLGGTMQQIVAQEKPDILVIFLGVNDVWHGDKGTPPDEFKAGLSKMVAIGEAVTAKVVLATMACIGEKPDGTNPFDKKLDEYAQIVRDVAKETHSTLVDVRKEFMGYLVTHNVKDDKGQFKCDNVMTKDGVHMLPGGDRLLADCFSRGIMQALTVSSEGMPCLVPWPRTIRMMAGSMVLGPAPRIVATDPKLAPLAGILADEIEMATGYRMNTAADRAKRGDIVLSFGQDLKGETYTLDVSDRATVRGANYRAVAMGTVTLLQSVRRVIDDLMVPRMSVADGPQSEYCGLMVDVARRPVPTDVLRQCVMLCRLYKIRYFHLHLTDDQAFTFPSTAYPMLGTNPRALDMGAAPARYSLDELKSLVRFADERGVTIVPEIAVPGNSGALQREMPGVFGMVDPASGVTGDVGVINLANEGIYPVLDTIVGELCAVFASSPYVHIGGDECQWAEFEKRKEAIGHMATNRLTTGALFARFINRMNAIVKKHGRCTICWSGFEPGMPVDKDIIVMAGGESNQMLVSHGYRIINVPRVPSVYSSPRDNYEWDLWSLGRDGVGMLLPLPPTNVVIGAQTVLWERPGDDTIRLLRHKAPARNEHVYNPTTDRSYDDFSERLVATDHLLDALILPVRIFATGFRPIEGATAADTEAAQQRGGPSLFSKELTIRLDRVTTWSGEKIHYTLDGSEPTQGSPVYVRPFTISEKNTRRVQPGADCEPIAEATLKVRLFAGGMPCGFTRTARYCYDYIGAMPRCVACRLFEAPADMTKVPDDPSDLKLVYRGLEPWINLRGMPHVRLPQHRCVGIWGGTAVFDTDAVYEFALRSSGGTSQLFIDQKLVVERTGTEANVATNSVRLSAGPHAVKVSFCGSSDLLGVECRPSGEQHWSPLTFKEIGATIPRAGRL